MPRTTVSFDSAGIPLVGHLYTPDAPASGPRPALVVGHPGTGVKEQTAGTYARRMAEHGFVTLAFDAAYQGESGGLPRGLEDPAQRVEDFKAAVSYLTTRTDVDADRIGLLGICASGGYSLAATGGDRRVKAVATVSTAEPARQFRLGADGTQDPAVFQALLDAAAAARSSAARGEDPGTLTVFPETAEQARALGGRHGAEGFEYYCTPRGRHERSAKALAWESIDRMACHDAFFAIPLIGPRPILQIIGERAVTAWMAVEAHQRATGPKEIHWIKGAGHVDLYDRKEYVDPAIDKLTDFYTTHLTTD
ncbi:alpha/beta hydrolase [Streptomyces sp. NEAU-sy36]|uniref:alpha/beta hydrolase n=1 Tax=unclassified Streptomyces TaxID=2593676 RepID=UPI0015D57EA1|nr:MULTISPECIES: alpha/beta hydrolase [unclassified Streptomyces]QLJ02703.1 alpha/beta hydrolase [Streptomyces sp. NEAU-sy36]